MPHVLAMLSPLLTLLPISPAPCQAQPSPRLRIDPVLLAAVTEVYGLIAEDDNPVWPGWNASDTPILLYLPDVQDALINHPSPPHGFQRVDTGLLPAGWSLHLRNGATEIGFDGQNTSREVGGVETLVVADTLSNMRPRLVQLLGDPRGASEKQRDLDLELLGVDPYQQLAFVVHEAFHVHQRVSAPDKSGNELALLDYPWLAAENNAAFALEGELLARALETRDLEAAYLTTLEWLAVRLDRRAALSGESVAYEDGTEFNEGLAKYTEWRLAQVLEGRVPTEGLRWARDFRGFEDLRFWRERSIRELRASMAGERVVNDDPYGSGMLRFRLYDSGMAIAALLDRLEAEDWKSRIFQPGTTLTELVRETLVPSEDDLREALVLARERLDWTALVAQKRELEHAGQSAAREAAQRILTGDALFTIDYSALGQASVAWSFTPFGITRVDDDRVIYSQIPVRASIGSSFELEQELASPVLHDSARRTIQFRLVRRFDPPAAGDSDAGVLELPGARVRAPNARLAADGQGLRLTLAGD